MENPREGAILGGLGMCIGLTAAMWLPNPGVAVPLFGLAMTALGMAVAASTGWRIENRVPPRLQSIQDVRQYARVYRL